jgi:hypothetical protein
MEQTIVPRISVRLQAALQALNKTNPPLASPIDSTTRCLLAMRSRSTTPPSTPPLSSSELPPSVPSTGELTVSTDSRRPRSSATTSARSSSLHASGLLRGVGQIGRVWATTDLLSALGPELMSQSPHRLLALRQLQWDQLLAREAGVITRQLARGPSAEQNESVGF